MHNEEVVTRDEKILSGGVILIFTLLCIANVLLLPPYEGFDETAHYSYISILSDRHEIPDFRLTPLDATVENDRLGLPRPYSWIPPFEANGGLTYSNFFNNGFPLERETVVRRLWQKPLEGAFYIPGQGANWEGQHPPLYYILMNIPYRLARTWPPGVRLLFLRLISVALACGSLIFWLKTVNLLQSRDSRRLLLLGGLAIVFFPSLFYDLARLGNDSLVTLSFAGSFYFLLSTYITKQERLSDFVGLALTLGLGLLTKLFFLTLWAGAILFSLWLGMRVAKINFRPLFLRMSLLVGCPLLLAGWWFGLCYVRYGEMITSSEAYMFQQIANPPGDQLTSVQFFAAMLRAVGAFVTTFLWCGTWSWVRPPHYLYACFVPLFALTGWGLISFVRGRGQTETRQVLVVSLFLLVPLLLGFVYHMYLRVKFTGMGMGTGGYYLFLAWPIIGIWFAFSFEARKTVPLKIALLSAFVLVSFFEIAGWWRSALVYSGIVEKVGTSQTGIGFLAPTVGNVALVLDRLRALAFPQGAMILYVLALLLQSILVVWTIFFLPLPPAGFDRSGTARQTRNLAAIYVTRLISFQWNQVATFPFNNVAFRGSDSGDSKRHRWPLSRKQLF